MIVGVASGGNDGYSTDSSSWTMQGTLLYGIELHEHIVNHQTLSSMAIPEISV